MGHHGARDGTTPAGSWGADVPAGAPLLWCHEGIPHGVGGSSRRAEPTAPIGVLPYSQHVEHQGNEDEPRTPATPIPDLGHPANMADVARLAGVSIATVSRALRDVPGVGETTRQRVREVADQLSYVISPEASSLSRRETGRVAVVMSRIDVWFYAAMLGSIERALRAEGIDVLVYQVDGPLERDKFVRDLPARRKVDAVVLAALPLSPEQRDRLDLLGVPMVIAGGQARGLPHVDVDDRAMGRAAVDLLLDAGHREIAMVRTSDTDATTWDADLLRVAGYREALAARGIAERPELLVTEPYGVNAGADAVERLLALDTPPTAVFAYSDEIAASVTMGAQRHGLRVPEDLSVVGIDGHPFSELFGLSTFDQRVEVQGEEAAAIAVRLIRGEPGARSVRVPHLYVDRGSVRPPG